MATYFAAVLKDADSAYGIVFPDVPGCFSAGDTFDEAIQNAAEALHQHAEVVAELGQTMPAPRSFEDLLADPEVLSEIAGAPLIAVPLSPPAGPIEVSVSFDRTLLDAIEDAARARGMSRAAFLVEAAREKIAG